MATIQDCTKLHHCTMPAESESEHAGGAIDYCLEYTNDPGKLFAGTGEYESQVNFCPICGLKAGIQIKITT